MQQALRAPAPAAPPASTSGRARALAPPRAATPRPLARPPRAAPPAQQQQQQDGGKTVLVKTSGDQPGAEGMPFPWSEKDPYKLPVSIERVQRLLLGHGWDKPWVDQIVDRIMKGTLKTTEERASGVVDYLASVGLKQDEICNMASVSVVLLGLNPQTRLAPVVAYLQRRGVPASVVPELLLEHPRIFEYRVTDEGAAAVAKGAARIQVDVVSAAALQAAAAAAGAGGKRAAAAAAAVAAGLGGTVGEAPAIAVNYYREGASFLESPVSPAPPMPSSARL
jgi:hypothetical protein